MYWLKIFFLLIIVSFLTNCEMATHCQNKDRFIHNFEKFAKDIREHSKELEEKDWVAVDKEFELYVDQCYPKFKDELSLSEKISFWKSTLAYTSYRSAASGDIHLKINDLKIDLSGEMNELSIESKQELEKYIKEELRPELEDAIDEVVDAIKEVGDELKNWLKK